MDKRYRIAVIPGDGIGKEVVPEGMRVLEAAAARIRHRISLGRVAVELRLLREARPDDARGLVRADPPVTTRSSSARSAGRRRCPITSRCGAR